ncbi:endonuclease/exonuclease/phosphatase family protein [bacterium]|nr:endonuclease/exonuclease/phosphatase family protein [bacterium]
MASAPRTLPFGNLIETQEMGNLRVTANEEDSPTEISRETHSIESKPMAERFSRVLFWLTVGLQTLLFLFYLVVSDRAPWGEAVAIWPPFFWGMGLAPLILLSFRPKKWHRPLILVGYFLLFLALTVEWWPLLRLPYGNPSNPPSSNTFRFVSWNVAGTSKDQWLPVLQAVHPDICFLQETPDGRMSLQPEDLSGYWQGFQWEDSGDTAILSRFSFASLPGFKVGPWPNPQVARFHLDGDDFLGFNLHLMLPPLILWPVTPYRYDRLSGDHTLRVAQFRPLVDGVKTRMAETGLDRALIAGDFNTPGRMASMSPVRKALRDAWLESGRGWSATMTRTFPVSRIDHCWLTPNLEPSAAWILDRPPSDHRMLVVDVEKE